MCIEVFCMDVKHELKGNNQMRCKGKVFTGPQTDRL